VEKKVNIGIIGVGAFMARQHLPNIIRNSLIHIKIMCDRDEDLLQQRKKEFQPDICTTDARKVFQDPEVDVVFVGTRSSQHACFIEKSAQYGKHVFVEKPMVMTYEETACVLKVVKKSNINVGIGFNRRFAPIMVEAKRLFKEFREGPANIVYRIVDDHRIRPAYIFDMNDGGGHLLQECCHIFDLLSWFLDEEPVEIYAAGPMETDNVVIIKYSDGSLVTLLCSGKGGLFYPKELMEVFCNHTTLVMDNFYELRLDGPEGNFMRTFPLDVKSDLKIEGDSMTNYYQTSFAQRPSHDVVDLQEGNQLVKLKVDKGHNQIISSFSEAVIGNKPFSINAVDGARATVCALKAYESIRKNKPITISTTEYGIENYNNTTN